MRIITNKRRSFFGTFDALILIFIIAVLGFTFSAAIGDNVEAKEKISLQDQIRLDRIRACIDWYEANKERVDEIYLHNKQNKIARCASYATLVFAKESWFWKSLKCINNFNCFWIRNSTHQSWVEYSLDYDNFKIYKSYQDANTDFGSLYFRWHFNRSGRTFVNVWSETDQETYASYINNNYYKIYNEMLTLMNL